MPVRELLHRMDSREISEWMAYNQIEPFDERWRGDARAGVVASTIANVNRGKGVKAFTPIDFMLFADKPKQQPKELSENLKAALLSFSPKQD